MKLFLTILVAFYCFPLTYANTVSDTLLIRNHLKVITKNYKYRNHTDIETLNRVADYIHKTFKKHTDSVRHQEYVVNGQTYKNVICTFNGTQPDAKTIIIGAHYDVCGNQEGADDNASGVVGLLELSRLLKNKTLKYRIELVAYTLEEPPFFDTKNMGSYIHAKSLIEDKIDVFGMISLEMIGYYSDDKNSQKYPITGLSSIYGDQGNFITLVNREKIDIFSKKFCSAFEKQKLIKTVIFNSPKSLSSIEFSDHLNYWKFNFNALMITDTAFFRNTNYHTKQDTMEKLDIQKMAKVIDNTYQALVYLK